MAARTPEKPEATEEQPSEQGIETSEASEAPEEPHAEPSATEADPTSRPRLPHQRLLIPIIAAATAIVLGVGGWLIHTNVQLAEARDAYEASLNELSAAQDAADTANADLSAISATLSAHIDIAEQLVALLGEDGDILQAAAAATLDAKAVLEATIPTAPAKTAGQLSESPTVDEYDALRAQVDELVATVEAYTTALTERIAAFTRSDTELTAAWQAQTAAVPAAVEAALAANANGSQGTKDAVTAAGEALTALGASLDSEAVELWQALQSTSSTLAGEEKAYQDQKTAEEEAARQRARNSSGGGSSGGSAGGGSGGSIEEWLRFMQASVANEVGASVDDVHCVEGVASPDGSSPSWKGTLCTYSYFTDDGGERTGWRWFGLAG